MYPCHLLRQKEFEHLPYLIAYTVIMYLCADAALEHGFKPLVLAIIGYAAIFMIPAAIIVAAPAGFVIWSLYILLS